MTALDDAIKAVGWFDHVITPSEAIRKAVEIGASDRTGRP